MTYEPPESEIFALLSKRRRRLLIQMLREFGTSLTTIELAKRIGDHEYDSPSTSDLRSIQLSLYHIHLPKLEESGVVEYNDSEGTVHAEQNFDTLIHFLENVGEEDLPWTDE